MLNPKSIKKAQHTPNLLAPWPQRSLIKVKIFFFSNIVMLHIKRSALNHWWSSKNPFFKISKNVWVMAKKPSKNSLFCSLAIFDPFFGYKSDIFLNFKNEFLLDHQWFKAFLLMFNTTIFKKFIFDLYLWPLRSRR